jgi:hypothetical protein
VPSKLPWEKVKAAFAAFNDPGGYQKITEAAGGFDPLGTVVDEARTGGPVAPSIAQVPKEELPQLDRYAHGGNAYKMLPPVFRDSPLGLGAVGLVGAGYEASKALPSYLGDVVAAGTDPTYSHDSNTSKPSMANILSLLQGYGDAQAGANAERLKKLFSR